MKRLFPTLSKSSLRIILIETITYGVLNIVLEKFGPKTALTYFIVNVVKGVTKIFWHYLLITKDTKELIKVTQFYSEVYVCLILYLGWVQSPMGCREENIWP